MRTLHALGDPANRRDLRPLARQGEEDPGHDTDDEALDWAELFETETDPFLKEIG